MRPFAHECRQHDWHTKTVLLRGCILLFCHKELSTGQMTVKVTSYLCIWPREISKLSAAGKNRCISQSGGELWQSSSDGIVLSRGDRQCLRSLAEGSRGI